MRASAKCPIYELYTEIKSAVIESGFQSEIDWQSSLSIDELTESDFLRESAWVILSSGMRETVISKVFPAISTAFFDWCSSVVISANKEYCRAEALACFNHPGKIGAIIEIADHLYQSGISVVKENILLGGVNYLATFPFIGKTTSFHLAKNIGLEVAKPDRHLTRIAKHLGYNDVHDLCSEIAAIAGEKVSAVDLVLWRYAVTNRNYLQHISKIQPHHSKT